LGVEDLIAGNRNRNSNYGDLCLIIIGPPGSGKTAQAIRFSKKYRLNHISFGAILRSRSMRIDAIKKHTKDGTLVPNEMVIEILQKELSFPDVNSGFVLDGYPRNLQQAQRLDTLLLSTKAAIDLVIDLQMDSEELIRRVVRRRRCLRCKKQVFINEPPRAEDELCNICGSPLYRRSEDTEPIARKRLLLHEKHEPEIRSHYLSQDKLLSVYSDAKQDDLFEIVDRNVRTKLRW
jgi:adenylate kinase